MGKKVQIKPGFQSVLMPDGRLYDEGEQFDLTEAEYASLDAGTSRSITLLSTVSEPARVVPGSVSQTTPATRAMMALKTALGLGERSCAIQVLGDSTGNDTTDWPYLWATSLGLLYPAWTVQQRLWSDASQQYGATSTLQVGSAGLQHLDGVADSAKNTLLTPGKHPTSGNVDIRVRLQADNWTPAPVLSSLASRAGAAGTYSYWLNHTAGKLLQFVYSVNGTAILTAASTVALPFTGNQTGWVRVVAIANNGTQAEFRFYTSTDGVTWAQLGATVNATSYVLFDGGSSFEIGGRGTLAFAGKIYETEYRDGENGPLMAPSLPGLYGPNPLSTVDATVRGAPVLTLVNGSHAGASLSYLNAAGRVAKMTPNYGQLLTLVSDSHNEGGTQGRQWLTALDAYRLAVEAETLGSPLVLLTQNPQTGTNKEHARRRLDVLGYANQKNVALIDTYKAFLDLGSPASLMADSVHPNTAGSTVWRDTVHRVFQAG